MNKWVMSEEGVAINLHWAWRIEVGDDPDETRVYIRGVSAALTVQQPFWKVAQAASGDQGLPSGYSR